MNFVGALAFSAVVAAQIKTKSFVDQNAAAPG
jgi:hypothetical protein